MRWDETPECVAREACSDCRSNALYREQKEALYGPLDCPEGIQVNATLEQLPQRYQDYNRKVEEFGMKVSAARTRFMEIIYAITNGKTALAPLGEEMLTLLAVAPGALLSPLARGVIPVCTFMVDTGEAVPDAPCRGNFIECQNPAAPIYGAQRAWWSRKCSAGQCRFFAEAKA